MNSREAFEDWAKKNWMYFENRHDACVVWQAACAYQKEKDAAICERNSHLYDARIFADAMIRSQP